MSGYEEGQIRNEGIIVKKTKIVCTIGPASDSVDVLVRMMDIR